MRYLSWLCATYYSGAIVFFVPWISLNGLSNPFDGEGKVIGGTINNLGHTGDFMQSAIASFAVMVNVYHCLVIMYTRHFNGPIVACYVLSVLTYIVIIILDNVESFS